MHHRLCLEMEKDTTVQPAMAMLARTRCRRRQRLILVASILVIFYLFITDKGKVEQDSVDIIPHSLGYILTNDTSWEKHERNGNVGDQTKMPCSSNTRSETDNGTAAMDYHDIWMWAADAATRRELYPESPRVAEVLHALRTARIVSVDKLDNGDFESGTADKWTVVLEGGQKAMVKLAWDSKYENRSVCKIGFERPTAEIAAFQLLRLLGFRNSPFVTGRKVNLIHEVLPVASPAVVKQISFIGNSTCITGTNINDDKFKKVETLCPEGGEVEASIAYWIPRRVRLHSYPPRYKPYSLANIKQWGNVEFNNKSYCQWTRENQNPYEQLQYYYDMFDFSVVDIIIHHYDTKHYTIDDDSDVTGLTVRLDHGRSFCTSEEQYDHLHALLSPVSQCCTLRNTTYQSLLSVRGGLLGDKLRQSMASDPLAPLLHESWYPALERRLKAVLDVVERCAAANGWKNVLV